VSPATGTDTKSSVPIALMMRGLTFVAAACLLSLAVVWLVDRPTQAVLAEVEPTSSSSLSAVPATAPSGPTPVLKPTPVVTEAAVDPTPSRNFPVRQSVYNSEIRIVIVTE
jgi:hypothetical protein